MAFFPLLRETAIETFGSEEAVVQAGVFDPTAPQRVELGGVLNPLTGAFTTNQQMEANRQAAFARFEAGRDTSFVAKALPIVAAIFVAAGAVLTGIVGGAFALGAGVLNAGVTAVQKGFTAGTGEVGVTNRSPNPGVTDVLLGPISGPQSFQSFGIMGAGVGGDPLDSPTTFGPGEVLNSPMGLVGMAVIGLIVVLIVRRLRG